MEEATGDVSQNSQETNFTGVSWLSGLQIY